MQKKTKIPKGATLIEFALVLPVIIILFLALCEFSILLYDKAVIDDASRKGARYGTMLTSVNYPTTASVVTYTTNYTSGKLINFSSTATSPTVTATQSNATPQFGDTLTVTVQYTYTGFILHKLVSVSATHTLTSTTIAPYN
jgi:Flp pilus assembly protein TadG